MLACGAAYGVPCPPSRRCRPERQAAAASRPLPPSRSPLALALPRRLLLRLHPDPPGGVGSSALMPRPPTVQCPALSAHNQGSDLAPLKAQGERMRACGAAYGAPCLPSRRCRPGRQAAAASRPPPPSRSPLAVAPPLRLPLRASAWPAAWPSAWPAASLWACSGRPSGFSPCRLRSLVYRPARRRSCRPARSPASPSMTSQPSPRRR